MAKKKVAKRSAGKKSRSLNSPTSRVKPASGAPASEQDPKRRLGNFASAGEHAKRGSRTAGIVGQKKSQNKTDKRK
jgi:hypothetical protein